LEREVTAVQVTHDLSKDCVTDVRDRYYLLILGFFHTRCEHSAVLLRQYR